MLIIALVLALIGLVALVAAVVTSNELIAWVCIGASVIGVLLLIADALRSRRDGADTDGADTDDEDVDAAVEAEEQDVQDYPDEPTDSEQADSETEPGSGDADTGKPDTGDDEVPGVTEEQDGDKAGGAVEISPDPEETPKS
ncbi:MAG: hypothetical protein ACSLFA_17700 [Mycobacterium sp.]